MLKLVQGGMALPGKKSGVAMLRSSAAVIGTVGHPTAAPHPNELDCRRITRALGECSGCRAAEARVAIDGKGYVIRRRSSRDADSEGGIIDVAQLTFDSKAELWRLFRKAHRLDRWVPYGSYLTLRAALEPLLADPERLFWR